MNSLNELPENEKYIETTVLHANKKDNFICGDVSMCKRTSNHTTFILCDGLGSGFKAHIAATMCAARIYKSVELDVSIYTICDNITYSMNLARTNDIPFAAFTIIRILNNGNYTVITYEMPVPIIIENNNAFTLEPRYFSMNGEILAETTGKLMNNHGIMVFSDGVSQAGIGIKYPLSTSSGRIATYTNRILREVNIRNTEIFVNKIMKKIYNESESLLEDDSSVAVLMCRPANILNILTGPPVNKNMDGKFVNDFVKLSGKKVVCGSSTADMISRVLKKELIVKKMPKTLAEPPTYGIEGIDIVTEGVITLNQLYNLLSSINEDSEQNNPEFNEDYRQDSNICVINIYNLLITSDIVKFYIGKSKNISHENITFRQLGILSRDKIVNLIEEKLNNMGKLVIKEFR